MGSFVIVKVKVENCISGSNKFEPMYLPTEGLKPRQWMWKVVCDWLKSVLLKTRTCRLTHKTPEEFQGLRRGFLGFC